MAEGESTVRWPLFPELGRGLSYALHRSRRRTLAIEVHPHGAIVVRSPLRLSHRQVEEFLRSRRQWIADRLAEATDARSVIPPLPGAGFVHHRGQVISWDGTAAALERWQRTEALAVFGAHLERLLPALGVAQVRYHSLAVRKMRRRWGSCSANGKITLNEYLIRVPDACSEAVVAHEIAHLVYMDHGPRFHALVRQILPNYEEADQVLNGWTAMLKDLSPSTNNGARGPVEHHVLWFDSDQDALAQSSSKALVNADAIISGVRPSM